MTTVCFFVTVAFSCQTYSNMFPNLFPVYLTLIISLTVVVCDFISINWNASTDRGNSHLEREYKYPMYQKVSPFPCDLTDSCDAFCCEDPDCDDVQKESFQCSESQENTIPEFDCKSEYYDKPDWMSWLCYVFKNPIYLGKFYATPNKIEKIGQLKNIINNKGKKFVDGEPSKPKSMLKFGSPIMTYTPMSDSFPSISPLMMKTPVQDSSLACIRTPVKYLLKGMTTCLEKLTPDLCKHSQALSILPYLVKNTSVSHYSNTPVVLKSLDFLEGIDTEIEIKCIKSKLQVHNLKKRKLYIFEKGSECEESVNIYQTKWNKHTCENVLAYVQHHFTVNGSDLVKLRVEYGVMNITVPNDIVNEFSDSALHQYIYTKQTFNISFHDIMNSSFSNENSTKDDDLYFRGYFTGEELNFGYKSIENSSAVWRKGFVGVFKNRRSCEPLSPVTFGFDSFSTCEISKKFSNCTQLRNEIEKHFDNLLQGDKMAAFGNLRPPYNATVPLLRNYPTSEISANNSRCSVPLLQDLLIQYTPLVSVNGIAIHKIVGVRVDRFFQNVTFLGNVALMSRILFLHMPSSTDKSMSRFWTEMFSQELSETSWLNIFKAFEDVNTFEREEITFWCIFLTISVSTVAVFTKLDFNLGITGVFDNDWRCIKYIKFLLNIIPTKLTLIFAYFLERSNASKLPVLAI